MRGREKGREKNTSGQNKRGIPKVHGVTTATELSRKQGRAEGEVRRRVDGRIHRDRDERAPVRVVSGEEVKGTGDNHGDIKKIIIIIRESLCELMHIILRGSF